MATRTGAIVCGLVVRLEPRSLQPIRSLYEDTPSYRSAGLTSDNLIHTRSSFLFSAKSAHGFSLRIWRHYCQRYGFVDDERCSLSQRVSYEGRHPVLMKDLFCATRCWKDMHHLYVRTTKSYSGDRPSVLHIHERNRVAAETILCLEVPCCFIDLRMIECVQRARQRREHIRDSRLVCCKRTFQGP